MALHTLATYEATEGEIVIPSGSCAAMIKHGYPELFAKDPVNLERAHTFSRRIYELSEFLVDIAQIEQFHQENPIPVAYHASCHLLREMKVDRQPKTLLENSGFEVHKLEPECCGFGGIFSIDHADVSAEMMHRKITAIENTGVYTVVACDVSCLLHIEGGLRHKNSPVRCIHIAQLLAGQQSGLH